MRKDNNMTLEEFYELNRGGTRVFIQSENDVTKWEEMPINQFTETWRYEVDYFRAVCEDLVFVYVK